MKFGWKKSVFRKVTGALVELGKICWGGSKGKMLIGVAGVASGERV